VAVHAYASWKPELALHYIKNILKQDSIDGLAFQRYARKDQSGQGDDILSGNSLAIVGLYQSVYGFNPLYNRFYLNPHITSEISGSRLFYHYRGERLTIGLYTNLYSVSNKRFTISSKNDFGFFGKGDTVLYFNKDNPVFSIKAIANNGRHLNLNIIECHPKEIILDQTSTDASFTVVYYLNQLLTGRSYLIYGDGILLRKIKSDNQGKLMIKESLKYKKIRIVLEEI